MNVPSKKIVDALRIGYEVVKIGADIIAAAATGDEDRVDDVLPRPLRTTLEIEIYKRQAREQYGKAGPEGG